MGDIGPVGGLRHDPLGVVVVDHGVDLRAVADCLGADASVRRPPGPRGWALLVTCDMGAARAAATVGVPSVVVSGPGVSAEADGVPVVAASSLGAWLRAWDDGCPLSPAEADAHAWIDGIREEEQRAQQAARLAAAERVARRDDGVSAWEALRSWRFARWISTAMDRDRGAST